MEMVAYVSSVGTVSMSNEVVLDHSPRRFLPVSLMGGRRYLGTGLTLDTGRCRYDGRALP